MPVAPDAPLSEYQAVAARYPAFRVDYDDQRPRGETAIATTAVNPAPASARASAGRRRPGNRRGRRRQPARAHLRWPPARTAVRHQPQHQPVPRRHRRAGAAGTTRHRAVRERHRGHRHRNAHHARRHPYRDRAARAAPRRHEPRHHRAGTGRVQGLRPREPDGVRPSARSPIVVSPSSSSSSGTSDDLSGVAPPGSRYSAERLVQIEKSSPRQTPA